MSVNIRRHPRGGWDVDINVLLATGERHRERRKLSASYSKTLVKFVRLRPRSFAAAARASARQTSPDGDSLAEGRPIGPLDEARRSRAKSGFVLARGAPQACRGMPLEPGRPAKMSEAEGERVWLGVRDDFRNWMITAS